MLPINGVGKFRITVNYERQAASALTSPLQSLKLPVPELQDKSIVVWLVLEEIGRGIWFREERLCSPWQKVKNSAVLSWTFISPKERWVIVSLGVRVDVSVIWAQGRKEEKRKVSSAHRHCQVSLGSKKTRKKKSIDPRWYEKACHESIGMKAWLLSNTPTTAGNTMSTSTVIH